MLSAPVMLSAGNAVHTYAILLRVQGLRIYSTLE